MKYYLGIDGGGTKTSYLVIDDNKKIVKELISDGTSIDTYPLSVTKKRLKDNISKLNYKFESIYAGLGGIVCKKDEQDIINIIKSIRKDAKVVDAHSDVTNALEGAVNGDGIILISGTGGVAFGKNKNITHRCGGYCYQEEDIGSSYFLGYRALQYLARVIDKRLPRSKFSDEIAKAMKLYDFASLAKYFMNINRKEVASLAKIVTKNADNKYAKEIILENALGAANMINTVYKECKFKKAKFSLIGGLANADTLYKKTVLKNINKNIKYVPKKYEASYGSALLAYKLIHK